jgi:hypothetical protein
MQPRQHITQGCEKEMQSPYNLHLDRTTQTASRFRALELSAKVAQDTMDSQTSWDIMETHRENE